MCGLPMLNPRNRAYKVWAFMLIALDAIYTAYIVPISVGFRVSDTQWNWVAVTDFTAGALHMLVLSLNALMACLQWKQAPDGQSTVGLELLRIDQLAFCCLLLGQRRH